MDDWALSRGLSGTAAEVNRFSHEYGVIYLVDAATGCPVQYDRRGLPRRADGRGPYHCRGVGRVPGLTSASTCFGLSPLTTAGANTSSSAPRRRQPRDLAPALTGPLLVGDGIHVGIGVRLAGTRVQSGHKPSTLLAPADEGVCPLPE